MQMEKWRWADSGIDVRVPELRSVAGSCCNYKSYEKHRRATGGGQGVRLGCRVARMREYLHAWVIDEI
jgi:hypothetical protein